jgi:hypothetical protein
MTKPDPADFAEEPSEGAILLRRAAIATLGGIVLIFIAGMITGFTSHVIETGGFDLKAAAILGAMLLVAGGVAYAMWRLWPEASDEPVAPRVRNARRILIAACLLGAVPGFMVGIGDEGALGVFSNAPVSPVIAAALIASWLIIGPLVTWLWWRQIDEHEAGAYREGGLVAAHAYLFVSPAWWMATRAGWLPPQDPMLVVLAVCLVWCLVWFVRRYF